MNTRTRLCAALVAVGSLVLAACGDDDETTSTSTPAAGGETTDPAPSETQPDEETPSTDSAGAAEPTEPAQATGEPIVIGSVVSDTGAGVLKPTGDGLVAFVNYVNSQGGIHGRPVEIDHCDDAGDVQKNATCARQIADNPAVVAVAGSNSRHNGAATAVFAESSLPFVCPLPVTGAELLGPTSFCLSTGASTSYLLSMQHYVALLPEKPTKATYTSSDTELAHQSGALFKAQAEALGIELVESYVSTTTADYLPAALAVVAEDPDFVLFGFGVEIELAFAQALAAAGNTTPAGTLGALLPQSSLDQLGSLPYDISFDSPFPPADGDDPELVLYRQWMEDSGFADEIGGLSLAGWLSGRVVAQALEQLDPNGISRESLNELFQTGEITGVPLLQDPLTLANAPTQTPGLTKAATATSRVSVFSGGVVTYGDEDLVIP